MDLIIAYILAYSCAYFATGLFVENPIARYPFGASSPGNWFDRLTMLLIGAGLVLSAIYEWWPLVLVMGLFEAFSVMLQWWHLIIWNIPDVSGASPIHQVSMSLTNLACAVCLFTLL